MTQFVIANNVNTQLASAASSSATTLTLASSTNLPTLAAGQVMPLVLNDAATGLQYEVVYVTAISGVTLTVERAQEGTGALNWSLGDYAYCAPTQGTVATLYGNPAIPFSVANAILANQAVALGQAVGVYSTAPASQVGPVIWVQDRQQTLFWQTIGTFTGYASPQVGLFHWGSDTTPRPFQELLIGQTIDATQSKYAALLAYLNANPAGLVVPSASWTAGTFNFVNLGSGQYKMADMRNQIIRATGTNADTANARGIGTYQADALQKITGSAQFRGFSSSSTGSVYSGSGVFGPLSIGSGSVVPAAFTTIPSNNAALDAMGFDSSRVVRSSTETRGPNTALSPMIFL